MGAAGSGAWLGAGAPALEVAGKPQPPPSRLQQFITSSTWDYRAVRRNVARWFAASFPVEALVIDNTGFPKDGSASPCVARQYSGTLGKTANCQIGVSVHLAGEHASCAADWRLFCPESWDDAALADPVAAAAARRRREQARIPDGIRHREKWRLALEMLDEMAGPGGWGILEQVTAAGGTRPVVTADAGYGDNTTFRLELEDRRWQYVLAVKGTTSAHAGDARPVTRSLGGGPGRPPRPAYPGPAASLRQLAIAHADQVQPVTWRQGTKTTTGNPDAAMTSHFLAIRVRPANRDIPRAQDGSLPDCWLLAQWPPAADEPTDYWLSNLPPDTPIAELVRPAKIRWRVEHDYRELKTGLGLDHFEGRSARAWCRTGRSARTADARSCAVIQAGLAHPRRRDAPPRQPTRLPLHHPQPVGAVSPAAVACTRARWPSASVTMSVRLVRPTRPGQRQPPVGRAGVRAARARGPMRLQARRYR